MGARPSSAFPGRKTISMEFILRALRALPDAQLEELAERLLASVQDEAETGHVESVKLVLEVATFAARHRWAGTWEQLRDLIHTGRLIARAAEIRRFGL